MTAISLYPRVISTTAVSSAAGAAALLRLEDRRLAAGRVVLALASDLAEFNDNIRSKVEPTHMITVQIHYGGPHVWRQTRTLQDVAAVLIRGEQIAFEYFVRTFPVVNSVSCP